MIAKRGQEGSTFGWLPGLVISVLIAIACLAIIVGLFTYFKAPAYAEQSNEFHNFVNFYKAFQESDLEEATVYNMIAKEHLYIAFDGRRAAVRMKKYGTSSKSTYQIPSPCGSGGCVCLYTYKRQEHSEPTFTKVKCEDITRIPYIDSRSTFMVQGPSKLELDTIWPSIADTPNPQAPTAAPLVLGAPHDHELVAPLQRMTFTKKADGLIMVESELTAPPENPMLVDCQEAWNRDEQLVINPEYDLSVERCVNKRVTTVYPDGKCVRVKSDGSPYPWNDPDVPEEERNRVQCNFEEKAQDYLFHVRQSTGTSTKAPALAAVSDANTELSFEFKHSDLVPDDAKCSIKIKAKNSNTEREFDFVDAVDCKICKHFDAPTNICYLMPLQGTAGDNIEIRDPLSISGIIYLLEAAYPGDPLLDIMQASADAKTSFSFEVEYEATSTSQPDWSYSESQQIAYVFPNP